MAELAVGLSKSVLVGAITKVQSAIDEDARLRQKVKRDLVFITLEFEMMRSFLDDANQEMKNNLVRTWVKHIRQLAYDVEDCVENVAHLDDKPMFWRRLLPSFLAPALLLDQAQAVEEIEQLKGRVEDVHNCYRRYNLINIDSAAGAGSKPAAVILLQPEDAAAQATALDMLIKARRYAAEKRQQFLGDLTQLITSSKGNDLQVISVWGTGGHHGTTSIILKAYNDPEICHKFTCRAWVKLIHPFNPHHFIRNLMVQFCANSASKQHGTIGLQVLTKMEATSRSQADLLMEFEQLLTKETYLVVFEDLSNMEEWHAIRTFLPHTGSGSRIIVSTQQSEVASLCIGSSYQILELKQYSAEHSVCALFSKEPGFPEVGQSSSYDDRRVAAEWMNNSPLIGRASEMNELRKCAGSARVMSVWGVAGVGKSAVVRHLYYDRMLHTNQFDKFIWVDVCQPFNLRDFCRSLLLDFHSEKDPIDECRKLLKEHRCLVVIDDLQTKEEWNLLQSALVSESSKSVIIVITNEANIAIYCTNNADLVFNVKCLHAEAASDLFRQEVNRKNPVSPLKDHTDREIGEVILKCGGFPKVIVAIAGLLAKTQNDKLVDTVSSFKRKFMLHLEADPDFYSLRGLFDLMHFIILNPPDFLKPCIFYLSIFPQDYNIRRRRLVRRWIAEGYSTESTARHMKQNAENFFSELIQLSIFQQVWQLATTSLNNTAMVGFYKVNGFIREYIISRPTVENLVFELEGSCAIAPQHKGRHLIISQSWDRDRIVFDSIDFSRLRSVTVFGHWRSFFISERMKMLQVLDLEDASGVKDNDLEQMVKLLRRLKFISLRGCHGVCHIPNTIGGLRQLQTLDVRHTSIVTLPDSIAELQNIQYIRVGTTFNSPSTPPSSSSSLTTFRRRRHLAAVEVPRGIGKLTALHTIGVVNVSASGGKAVVKELKKLTQLRKLGVSGINGKNSKEFISAISGHVHLESLSVQLDKDNQGCLDDISIRWQNLHSLKLYGLQDRLPLARSQLSQLRKLNLEMATLEKNDIEFLAMLPELCILRLSVKQIQNGKLNFYAEMYGEQLLTFQNMKILEIACSSNRLHVTFGSMSMKNLELLTFDCSSAGYQLTGLNNLSELKEVFLKGTDDEIIKTTLKTQLANHPNTPAVKLEELTRWR